MFAEAFERAKTIPKEKLEKLFRICPIEQNLKPEFSLWQSLGVDLQASENGFMGIVESETIETHVFQEVQYNRHRIYYNPHFLNRCFCPLENKPVDLDYYKNIISGHEFVHKYELENGLSDDNIAYTLLEKSIVAGSMKNPHSFLLNYRWFKKNNPIDNFVFEKPEKKIGIFFQELAKFSFEFRRVVKNLYELEILRELDAYRWMIVDENPFFKTLHLPAKEALISRYDDHDRLLKLFQNKEEDYFHRKKIFGF